MIIITKYIYTPISGTQLNLFQAKQQNNLNWQHVQENFTYLQIVSTYKNRFQCTMQTNIKIKHLLTVKGFNTKVSSLY